MLAAAQDVPAAEPDEDMQVETEIEIETEVAEELPQAGHSDLPDYQVAEFVVPGAIEPHDLPVSSMAPIVLKVVALEGPVHEEEIARRVAGLFGKQKAGSRIVAAVEKALSYAKRSDPSLMVSDGFWMTKQTSAQVPLRNRSRALPSLRKAAMLPPAEIAQAIRKALNDNGALSWDELPRAVALLFGFLRTGPEFRPAIVPVIEAMIAGAEVVEGPAGLQLSS